MAVYTEINDEELAHFVAQYDIGAVLACKGIAEGVENTNYLLRTEKGAYILTLYEKRVKREDLPFFIELMKHLSARGVTCPTPIRRRDGEVLGQLAGRPAAMVSFLEGIWIKRPGVEHCGAVGRALAAMHNAALDFPMRRPNALSLAGWQALAAQAEPRADSVLPGLAAAIAGELAFHEAHWPRDLPAGVIHADLFPDNVFFLRGRLSGLIDFYFACTDLLAYDVAICLNAWCFETDHAYNATKGRALLAGYRAVRPLSAPELEALPVLARGSALRFMLTRLVDWLNVPAGALVKPKDPLEYWKKLRFHQHVASVAEYGFEP
ncbi:homoserine kinase [Labrys monachus]|uniref:Homoserine kinase n=1 Tax=Labrys monachus TaxID=217067 RepID=A0ABU0FBP6_9HYPH|nr:homoserine kinase [Labrys monachus]MDQ0391544.1 homoserine kinase type II [Labrys monachus]